MRKVLVILGQLSDLDVEWLGRVGTRQEVARGEAIIQEGKPSPALYFILSGRFGVRVAALGSGPVALMDVGEIAGEMSFVDASPPSATVEALEPGTVLAIPRTTLQRRLDEDAAFAARFYKAMAMFLSDRIRQGRANPGSIRLDEGQVDDDEIDPGVLAHVSAAGDRFNRILKAFGEV
jgi:CRP/FNR family cyclic AMP-dependent transcriptional regulator